MGYKRSYTSYHKWGKGKCVSCNKAYSNSHKCSLAHIAAQDAAETRAENGDNYYRPSESERIIDGFRMKSNSFNFRG